LILLPDPPLPNAAAGERTIHEPTPLMFLCTPIHAAFVIVLPAQGIVAAFASHLPSIKVSGIEKWFHEKIENRWLVLTPKGIQ
jgi:hypothetical protein